MVSGDLRNAYWAHFASCAMRYLQEHDYQLLLAVRDSDASPEPLEFLVDRGVDGIIISGSDLPEHNVSPCPIVVHDTAAAIGDAVNPDFAPALDMALEKVRGRIAALFHANSAWSAVFPKVAARRGLDVVVHTVSLDPERRRTELRDVCRSTPEWMFVGGWHTLTQLQELMREEFPQYHPRIIAHANCRGEFLNAPEIACAIASSSSQLIREVCSMLLERIENGGSPAAEMRKIPCRCIGSGRGEFRALCTRNFELT
jgi:DNA-binding LacI/PurR family transcriptional regulator